MGVPRYDTWSCSFLKTPFLLSLFPFLFPAPPLCPLYICLLQTLCPLTCRLPPTPGRGVLWERGQDDACSPATRSSCSSFGLFCRMAAASQGLIWVFAGNEDVWGVPGLGGQPPNAEAETIRGGSHGLTAAPPGWGDTWSPQLPDSVPLPHLGRPIPGAAGSRMARNFSCSSSLKLFLIWKWFPNPSQERVSGTGNIFLLKTNKKYNQPSNAESLQPRL